MCERHVQHDHPRAPLADARHRLVRVVRERDDVDLGAIVEQGAQTEHHHVVVIDQDDGYGERGHHRRSAEILVQST
jgi:hypothetical protein